MIISVLSEQDLIYILVNIFTAAVPLGIIYMLLDRGLNRLLPKK